MSSRVVDQVRPREAISQDGGLDNELVGEHAALRVWLRLLTCTTLIESRVRTRLRRDFATTLPRFDMLAQLARYPDGLKMGELGQAMMVSGGSITGLTDQLEKEGWVERAPLPEDRRVFRVRLTEAGREVFTAMARTHETWIDELLAGLTPGETQQLYVLLGKLKQTVRQTVEQEGA